MLGPWLLATLPAHAAPQADWQATLDRVTRAVVSIRMDRPRAFEGSGAGNSIATGFVVDAERGLILTNRHVVTPGPNVAKAVFLNHEEVSLEPIYRDPVHDFGVFRYDPEDVQFMDAPSLRLRPDRARVGTSIRVVGNDSGEQISILDSTLARLDREAPEYGSDFNDFNTFYFQAASSTSGGSSGSPVVDQRGNVVALNAGGKSRAASSFYLPLDRVVRALNLIKAGEPVPRGTLQARFVYERYDELARLGLSEATEAAARRGNPEGSGLLVVRDVLPAGPGAKDLRVGDVIISAGGRPVYDFVTLEALLDSNVGKPVSLVIERDGTQITIEPTVGDLHDIIPRRYLTMGGGVLHTLSYHQARVMQVAPAGVYVTDSGYALARDGLPGKAILVEADGTPLRRLEDFEAILAKARHGQPIVVRWYSQGSPEQLRQTAIRMDRVWFPAEVCSRDDSDGSWPCEPLPEVEAAPLAPAPPAVPLPVDDKRARALASSLVTVECDIPYMVGGVPADNYVGGGVIVDAERGWVLVDRDTVPIAVAELAVVVAGAVRVPARLVSLHPLHNFAIVAYNPEQVKALGLTEATLSDKPLEDGDTAWNVTLERDGTLDVNKVEVGASDPVVLGIGGPPRFRDTNIEVVDTDPLPNTNGVLIDKKGNVRGFHASFSHTEGRDVRAFTRTLTGELAQEAVDFARTGELRGLGWELGILDLPTAQEQGLPDAEVLKLVDHDPERRGVLAVRRVAAAGGLEGSVKTGDLLLAVEGSSVTRYREIERLIQGRDAVSITVARRGEILDIEVPTERYDQVDIDRVLLWQGIRIHGPHRGARMQAIDGQRPYVAWRDGGSPAGRARIYAQRSIIEVNGTDTPTMDALIDVIRGLPEDAPVKVLTKNRRGEPQLYTLEPNPTFWPTELLSWTRDAGWTRSKL